MDIKSQFLFRQHQGNIVYMLKKLTSMDLCKAKVNSTVAVKSKRVNSTTT